MGELTLIGKTRIKELFDELKELRHYRDTTIGLWATYKEPEDKTGFFRLGDE